MEKLLEKSLKRLKRTPLKFKRYLTNQIIWDSQLIGIKGARGSGKTTLILQYAKQFLPIDKQTLYTSLDDLYFTENKLVHLAEKFFMQGGKYLLLDEVHQYPNWSREIKNIYDDLPELKVIFTGSSMMHLNKASGDLSRRAIMYELAGLSFREYLNFSLGSNYSAITFDDLINNHTQIAMNLIENLRPLAHFNNYLEHGYYPYFKEDINLYSQKLAETISLALNIDLPSSSDISYGSIQKIRLLLHIIAESVPFKPNISKLSERIGISRNSLIQFIRFLEELRIIKGLYSDTKGIGILQKPEKIYLHHPNLQYALANEKWNTGTLRESLFINQLGVLDSLYFSKNGDFVFKEYTFEIGGKNKSKKQIRGIENAFIVKDDIEIGVGNSIPIWLFGFLY